MEPIRFPETSERISTTQSRKSKENYQLIKTAGKTWKFSVITLGMHCVLCEVGNEFLNTIWESFVPWLRLIVLVFYLWDTGSIPDQPLRGLWWTMWHWYKFFSEYFGFLYGTNSATFLKPSLVFVYKFNAIYCFLYQRNESDKITNR